MKKVILVVLLALSLHGGEIACQEAHKNGIKHGMMVHAAITREDRHDYGVQLGLTIKWLDRALAECHIAWYGRQTAIDMRSYMLKLKRENRNGN